MFVFDGGAPVLKRSTLAERARRREGRRDDAVRTAGKLLALQVQRKAVEEKNAAAAKITSSTTLPEDIVYFDETNLPVQERTKLNDTTTKPKRKRQDQYDLPDLPVRLDQLQAQNDPRVMTHEELNEYAKSFQGADDVSIYDFSRIDYDGDFFKSLPPADQYNILNAARLRSRWRMGLSAQQLSTMFPNRLEFSKFQIERVKERNELTQRLMNLNGMNEMGAAVNRIAGERGREYVLVKNDGVDGGYVLGVITKTSPSKPILLDVDAKDEEASEDESEEEFEDVPLAR